MLPSPPFHAARVLLCAAVVQLYFSSEWASLLEVSFRNFIAGRAPTVGGAAGHRVNRYSRAPGQCLQPMTATFRCYAIISWTPTL
jgi:hypothetical protein